MMKGNRIVLLGVLLLVLTLCLGGCSGKKEEEAETLSLTNVSYDPTRELYTEYNALFTAWWEKQGGKPLTITQSHGGSGSQAIIFAAMSIMCGYGDVMVAGGAVGLDDQAVVPVRVVRHLGEGVGAVLIGRHLAGSAGRTRLVRRVAQQQGHEGSGDRLTRRSVGYRAGHGRLSAVVLGDGRSGGGKGQDQRQRKDAGG